MALYNKAKDRYGTRPVSFGWIDGICHSELLISLGISDDEIPNLISYNPKKKIISKLIGRFE